MGRTHRELERGRRGTMATNTLKRPVRTGIEYQHPAAFWFGVTAVTVGVLLHLPFYWSARHNHFILRGRTPDAAFWIGMSLIFIGLAATAYGLFPRLSEVSKGYVSKIKVRAMDEAKIR